MAVFDSLDVNLTAITGPFKKGMAEAQNILKGFVSSVTSLPALVGGAVAALGISVGVSELKELFMSSVDLVDGMDTMAVKVGGSTQALSELAYASDLSDTSLESLVGGLQKLNANLGSGDDFAKSIERFGLSAEELRQADPTGKILLISQALDGVDDPAERAALAVKLLGKSGQELLPFLTQSPARIRELIEEARQLGFSFDDKMVKALTASDDEIKKLNYSLKVVGATVSAEVAPVVNTLIQQFLEWFKTTDKGTSLAVKGMDIIREAIGPILDGVKILQQVWNIFGLAVHTLATGLSAIVGVLLAGLEKAGKLLGQDWELGSQFAFDLADANADEMEKKLQAIKDNWNSQWPSDHAEQFFDKLKSKTQELKDDLEKPRHAFTDIGDEIDKTQQKFNNTMKSWTSEMVNFGGSSREKAIFDFANSDNATGEQVRQLQELDSQLSAKEKLAELDKEAKQLTERLLTPSEKYAQALEKINELKTAGLITDETATRAIEKQFAEMDGQKQPHEVRFAAALDYGSAAAREAIIRHQFGSDPGARQGLTLAERQAVAAERSNSLLAKLAEERDVIFSLN